MSLADDERFPMPKWLRFATESIEEKLTTDIDKWLSPSSELRWRLNERIQGRDPGVPIHWKGLS